MRISPVLVALAVALGSGCSTIIKPTRPDQPITKEGDAVSGLRFDGEETILREPGMPLSPSRSWQREVANYTATSLNTILQTPDDAPAARTIVSFDLASPSVIQIGTWKEMTITMSSTLPDGSVIKSQPVSKNIDDPIEYTIITGMGVGGTILDVTAGISTLFFFFTRDPNVGLIAIGALLGGLSLNLGQSAGQYFVAAAEEKRWSNLYAEAIQIHAADVRKGMGTGPPRKAAPPPPPPTTTEQPPTGDPSDPPPPPLLETPKAP